MGSRKPLVRGPQGRILAKGSAGCWQRRPGQGQGAGIVRVGSTPPIPGGDPRAPGGCQGGSVVWGMRMGQALLIPPLETEARKCTPTPLPLPLKAPGKAVTLGPGG